MKGYGFLSFAKNFGENSSRNLSSKYSQKLLDHERNTYRKIYIPGTTTKDY